MAAAHDQIPEAALAWVDAGGRAALATVVETWGSAPRPAGSQLAISGEAELVGSVSGGCVEGAVVAEALEALDDGTPRLLEFGVSDSEAFAVGLACGGRIRVLVEPVGVGSGLPRDLLAALDDEQLRPEPFPCDDREDDGAAAVALKLQQPRDHGRRSTKTSISPPQGSPTAQASSSLIPYEMSFGSPVANTSCACANTSPSTQPPETEPKNVPSSLMTRLEPAGRGAEPQVSTTVASAARPPASTQASAASGI